MKNEAEKIAWMNERMDKGYSFEYIKGIVFNEYMNVGVLCVDDQETFYFLWE